MAGINKLWASLKPKRSAEAKGLITESAKKDKKNSGDHNPL